MAAVDTHEGTAMISRTQVSFWLMRAALTASLVMLLGISGPAAEEAIPREKQIADLERQIKELAKKLEELKRMPAAPATTEATLPAEWIKTLTWRCIGPASMGGRIEAGPMQRHVSVLIHSAGSVASVVAGAAGMRFSSSSFFASSLICRSRSAICFSRGRSEE